jgi:HD superfamily phosphohydrolase
MRRFGARIGKAYQGKALMADPIHRYIWFTVPDKDGREKTEKDLIDSPWIQRLRRIHQLQSARWVYPAAEHTRFQHALGTMHMAGEFGRHLYGSLREVCPEAPSLHYVEELLRVAGLLHDVGHGPFGHFFDDHFLDRYGLTHEILGQEIITKRMGQAIRGIRRSPSGLFERGEALNPLHVAYLIRSPETSVAEDSHPPWLTLLRNLFSGIYTVDNLDYIQRDAYTTGFSMDMIDIDRLVYYTFFTREGLTLHQAGTSMLTRFLNARLNLYSNVYYHRTTRALDLHLQEFFRETMDLLLPGNPLDLLDEYLFCDEWSLYERVRQWGTEKGLKKRLSREWAKLNLRQVKWKMSHGAELSVDQIQKGVRFSGSRDYERQIRKYLPPELRRLKFKVDLAALDPRPLNPVMEEDKRILVYNPATESVSPEPLREIYRFIPARVVHFRVFSLSHEHDQELAQAAEKALCEEYGKSKTNI